MRRSATAFSALLIFLSFVALPAAAQEQQVTHEVEEGETLWTIAQTYLGDGNQWTLILEANRTTIQDPDRIEVGMVLVIPGVEPPPAEVQEVTVVTPGEPVAEEPARDVPAEQEVEVAPTRSFDPCPGPGDRTIFFEGGEDERGCELEPPASRTAFYFDPEEDSGGGVFTDARAKTVAVARDAVFSAEWLIDAGAEPEALGVARGFARAELDRSHRRQAVTHELLQVELNAAARLSPGDLLQTFTLVRDVEGVGRILRPTGVLEVTEVQEAGLVAEVIKEFTRVRLGNWVRPVPAYEMEPGVHAQEVDSDVEATILSFADDRVIYPLGSAALLDVGEDQGIVMGDEFAAYVDVGEGWGGSEAARLRVVLVNGNVSTAMIVGIREPTVGSGDRVRLVGKMQ